MEDELLAAYHDRIGGTIVVEVPTASPGPGHWPDGVRRRYIDGVRLGTDYRSESLPRGAVSPEQLRELVDGRHVQLIEVKKHLERNVIGQALAGEDLLERDYAPVTIEPVALVQHSDPALAWVCHRRGIRVETEGAAS